MDWVIDNKLEREIDILTGGTAGTDETSETTDLDQEGKARTARPLQDSDQIGTLRCCIAGYIVRRKVHVTYATYWP
jgi:hypothetical protein